MKRITPVDLYGPRCYFTNFDYRITARTANLSEFRHDVERKLKVLLLLKSRIVCAASHLTSDFVFDFFRDNPELIAESHIIPAIRVDKSEISSLFGRIPDPRMNEKISFYEDHLATAVNWDRKDNTPWFRNAFLSEIKDTESPIGSRLAQYLPENKINSLIIHVESREDFIREFIEEAIADFPDAAKELLRSYRDMLYHIGGSSVVMCESALPQEDYIDYDIASPEQPRFRLSETNIFWKLFLEISLETFQRKALPVDLLDYLSFRDIIEIRQPLLDSTFQNKYDSLVKKAMLSIQKDEYDLVYDVEELEKLRSDLEEVFTEHIHKEVSEYAKKRAPKISEEMLSTSVSVGLGLLSFLPALSSITGITSLVKDLRSLMFNLSNFSSQKKAFDTSQSAINFHKDQLDRIVLQSDISDKSTLLDVVHIVTNKVLNQFSI